MVTASGGQGGPIWRLLQAHPTHHSLGLRVAYVGRWLDLASWGPRSSLAWPLGFTRSVVLPILCGCRGLHISPQVWETLGRLPSPKLLWLTSDRHLECPHPAPAGCSAWPQLPEHSYQCPESTSPVLRSVFGGGQSHLLARLPVPAQTPGVVCRRWRVQAPTTFSERRCGSWQALGTIHCLGASPLGGGPSGGQAD